MHIFQQNEMNYYELLEVSQNASPEVIKAAYKSLIQRYHPDKNPGNSQIAERASQVIQAYEILSDLDKRAGYDLILQQQSAIPVNYQKRDLDIQAPGAPARRQVVKPGKFYWYWWFLIALIIFSGWIILSLMKKRQTPESELKEIRSSIAGKQLTQEQLQEKILRIEVIFKEHPEILKREASAKADEEAARTISIFMEHLTVHLYIPDNVSADKGKPLVDSLQEPVGVDKERSKESGNEPDKTLGNLEHVLVIPVLGVKVGSFDSEKVIRHLESNTEYIRKKLVEKLAAAKYAELIKIDGEEYLKKIVLDSISDTTGTNRFENYPPSNNEVHGRYGVVDAFFPEDFSVK